MTVPFKTNVQNQKKPSERNNFIQAEYFPNSLHVGS